MKRKILALGLFGLCALALFTGEAKAFFGLLNPHSPWHRHNRYATHITCRPYNAFTPICWGNLVCDGCCPSPCGIAGGCMPMTMGAPPWACPSFDCGPGFGFGCGSGGCLAGGPQGGYMASDMPLMAPPPPASHPSGPMPDIRNQPFTPPAPMPLPNGPNVSMYPPQGIAQANFYPMYPQPYYAPMYYNSPYMGWSNMQPAPYYWYGAR